MASSLNIVTGLKVPMKWNFCLLFLWSSDSEFWSLFFEEMLTNFFSCFDVGQFQSKMCHISRAVKICKLVQLTSQGVQNLLAIMTAERNKRRSGKLFVTVRPVLASCKTPLTRKALSCMYFRKTKSEEPIVSDLFGYTGQTAKRPWYVSSLSKKVVIDFF